MIIKSLLKLRKCICIAFVFILFFGVLFSKILYVHAKQLSLYSISCALIDGDTGRVLYEKSGNDKRAMASTTKIMTLILALEYGEAKSMATVSEYAAAMPEVKLGVKCGEQYRLEDLMYSLILESHNDVAVVIAEHVGGSVEGFAQMMNEKAIQLGLTDTYFITPNGLDASDDKGVHSTTAIELAQILRYCLYESPKKDEFRCITATREYSFSDSSGSRRFVVHNKNAYLDMMEGAVSGKTGFTADAGYCYCCAVERDGRSYVIALLGCGWPGNKGYKWKDSNTLFNYGISNYNIKEISMEELGCDIDVVNGVGRTKTELICNGSQKLLLCNEDRVSFEYDIPDSLKAPVSTDIPAGRVTLLVNDEPMHEYELYPSENIEEYSYRYCLRYVYDYIF